MSAMGRAPKAGDQAMIERKLEGNYDKVEALGTPQACVDWINSVLDGESGFTKCPGTDWKSIVDFLKDGAVLCRLMNKLHEHAGLGKIPFKAAPKVPFHAMNNIQDFNKHCNAYGVADNAIFQTTDLVDGRKGPMLNVINCLNQLGVVANKKGFKPSYSEPEAPKADR